MADPTFGFAQLDPWPEPVDGEQLLDQLAATVSRYIVLPADARDVITLWIMHAWAIDAAQHSPLLIISAPEKGSGKTTLGSLLGLLVPNPLPSANITSASLFGPVDGPTTTLILDEADTFLGKRDDLRGIVNSGHFKPHAFTIRKIGVTRRSFSTWGPKIIIGIAASELNGTLIDRAIVIEMRRKTSAEQVEAMRVDKLLPALEPLRRMAKRWAADHVEVLRDAEPDIPEEIQNRARDNWRPLLGVASAVGAAWSRRGFEIAGRMQRAAPDPSRDSPGVQLLEAIRELFETERLEFVPTSRLLAWLAEREDRPWEARGRALTGAMLAKILRGYQIAPANTRVGSGGSGTVRGYERAQFADAFARYLSGK
jgi:putative DNA primase/helicase